MPPSGPPTIDDLLHHAEWVRRLAIRLAGPADGDDAAQDALLAAWRSPRRHDGNPRGFFATLLRNAVRLRARADARRQRRERDVAAATTGAADSAAAAVERAELHRHLVTLVLALDEPHRTLVLRHYFDGADVRDLAREQRCSPDAVRAHLRRARATLRRRLDADPRSRAALTGLLAHGAAVAPALAALPLLLAMKKTLLAVTAAGLAAALWIVWPAVPAPVPAAVGAAPSAAALAVAAAADRAADAAPAVADRRDATPATNGSVAAPAAVAPLRVRLRGLHPDAPWTAPVRLELRDGPGGDGAPRHDAAASPAADGTLALALPPWHARAVESALLADDPRYAPVALRAPRPFDSGAELVVDVQVVAVLTGRVVDADGRPVPAARVIAYRTEDGLPANVTVGETNTNAAGEFAVKAPPALPLAVVAVAMHEAAADGHRVVRADGAIADNGRVRADLVPTWVAASGGVAEPTRLGDVVLPAPALLTGVVRWSDGAAMPRAFVNVYASGGRTLLLGTAIGHYTITVAADGRVATGNSVRADQAGAFTAAVPAGVGMAVTAQPASGAWNAVGGAAVRVVAPQHVEIVVPRPIALAVVRDGKPAPRATVRLESAPGRRSLGVQTNRTDERGEMLLQLGDEHVVVTALDGPRRSAPRALSPDDVGRRFELVLDQQLAELRVDVRGDVAVRNVQLQWKRADGSFGGSERLRRDDATVPFRVHVEPGPWRLFVGPTPGDAASPFLLAADRAVDVPEGGLDVVLPAEFGGELHVAATDAAGVHVAGTCRLVDATRAELLPTFLVWSAHRTWGSRGVPGELKAGGPNECERTLPAGDYEMSLDFGARGSRRERVTIRPREVTVVRVRL
jgi:RNA polymerase sigma factor (sigma-70 family)